MLGWMMGRLVVMNAMAMVADKKAVVMVVLEREREKGLPTVGCRH